MTSTLTHMPTLLGIMLIGRLFECAPGGEDFAVGLNVGDRYRLSCYTEVNPVAPVDGRSIEARVDQREFTV